MSKKRQIRVGFCVGCSTKPHFGHEMASWSAVWAKKLCTCIVFREDSESDTLDAWFCTFLIQMFRTCFHSRDHAGSFREVFAGGVRSPREPLWRVSLGRVLFTASPIRMPRSARSKHRAAITRKDQQRKRTETHQRERQNKDRIQTANGRRAEERRQRRRRRKTREKTRERRKRLAGSSILYFSGCRQSSST